VTLTLASGQQNEDVVFDKTGTVNMRGGYDATFSSVVGESRIKGSLTIKGETVSIDRITIM